MPMQYKTRGQSAPQGKNRVYFCCHSEDFPLYFDRISEDILQRQNCAIWYDENGVSAPLDEDRRLELGQMQLFVMPVTARLLAGENQGLDAFRFAMEQHIPVLPLIQEPELEDRFNKICGDIQFLKPYDRDPTAVPYEEKLEKYLNAVLVGDELAQRVRDAFDAYIFLSYRKKDRKYAQELMRLIHQNDFCRDIAIWYDEYLTPGENFNDAIADAMAKSQLFTLAVTPNLVNEENYVMTVEYPEAKKTGKTILPIEVVSTDRAALEAHYLDVPDCVNAYDEAELSQALLDSLKHIALQERQKDPLHTFFIGLAYLSGIDVETDTGRGVSLITGAAEAGLNEAVQKLVSMYQNGEGVKRDYRKALEWQRKLAENCRNVYLSSGSESDGEALLEVLEKLGDDLYAVRDLANAERAYAEMEEVCIQLGQRGAVSRRGLLISYGRRGDIRMDCGDPFGAEKYYEKSLALCEQSAKETGTAATCRDLLVSYSKLGDLRKALGDLSGAEIYYEKGLKLSEETAKETGAAESFRDLAISCSKLGDIRKALGDPSGAKTYYEKCLAWNEKLAKETETLESRRDLSISYSRLGILHMSCGDPFGAREYFKRSLDLYEQLELKTGTAKSRRDLAIIRNRLGDACKACGDLPEAKKNYEKGLRLHEKLVKESVTVKSCRDLAESYSNFGDFHIACGDPSGAEEYYKRSFALRERLAKRTKTLKSYRDLSASYEKLGDTRAACGDMSGAEEYFKKALALREGLVKESKTAASCEDLAISYFKCAIVKNPPDTALLRNALNLYETLVKQYPDVIRYRKNRDMLARTIFPDV